MGEPPTTKGYTPSVFAQMALMLERAGAVDAGPGTRAGSITGLYTILVEGDDMTEPVADETRSILDGHIILSRRLAAQNHYPAIDVLLSASRVMGAITGKEHRKAAGRLRELLAKYDEVELLVKIGEYKAGADATTDEALKKIDKIRGFLRQSTDEKVGFADTVKALAALVG